MSWEVADAVTSRSSRRSSSRCRRASRGRVSIASWSSCWTATISAFIRSCSRAGSFWNSSGAITSPSRRGAMPTPAGVLTMATPRSRALASSAVKAFSLRSLSCPRTSFFLVP